MRSRVWSPAARFHNHSWNDSNYSQYSMTAATRDQEGILGLIVIRGGSIFLGSDIPIQKDQTYPYWVVAKLACVIWVRTSQGPLPIGVAHVCCGAKFESVILQFVRLYSAVAGRWVPAVPCWEVGVRSLHRAFARYGVRTHDLSSMTPLWL